MYCVSVVEVFRGDAAWMRSSTVRRTSVSLLVRCVSVCICSCKGGYTPLERRHCGHLSLDGKVGGWVGK